MSRRYPEHPWPSCHALIVDADRVLLVQRLAEPFKGYWGLPGGAVEIGETVAAAVVREVAEETGLAIQVEGVLGYKDAIQRDAADRVQFHFVVMYFLAHVEGGNLKAGDDAGHAEWVPIDQLSSRLVTDSVTQCLTWRATAAGQACTRRAPD